LKTDLARTKPYAVKVTRFDDEELQNATKSEFDILKNLDHPNIIKVIKFYHNKLTNE